MKQIIVAAKFLAQFIVTNTLLADSVLGKVFLEQMSFCPRLFVQLQANSVVVILLDVLNLDQAKMLGAVHHSQLANIVIIVHSALVNDSGASHIDI